MTSGDAQSPPTITVPAEFKNGEDDASIIGVSVFDANIYIRGFPGAGLTWWDNQNNFYRQIRNFKFDLTKAKAKASAIHWQVAQATSMQNIEITLRSGAPNAEGRAPGHSQVGINMENGSGGWFSDITIHGGFQAMILGSQQFTVRDIKIDDAWIGVKMIFGWTWLFARVTITASQIGFDFTTGGTLGATTHVTMIVDSKIGARFAVLSPYKAGRTSPAAAGSLMMENVDLSDSLIGISDGTGDGANVYLPGSQESPIPLWVQGNVWTIAGQAQNASYFNSTTCTFENNTDYRRTAQEITVQKLLSPIPRPPILTDSLGRWVGRARPQYEDRSVNDILSAKSNGLKGDGESGKSLARRRSMANSIRRQ